jgi:xanthine dehydrogenase large subunit
MRADRDDDMLMTGKRHDFEVDYEAGFDEQGRLHGVRCVLASRCGYSADLSGPVNDRALFHLDNAYRLPALHALSLRCKTHTQSNTAFRGFGGPQGMLAIEVLIDDVARALGLDPLDVRLANYYDDCGAGGAPAHNRTPYGMAVEDFVLHALSARLVERCGYRARRAAIRRANAASARIKRGIAFAPVKFGISFTATHYNQAGALLHVYTDGSVLLSHGGTEMGQGLYTKVRQVAAAELGLPVEQVHCAATDTARVPNTSATAASSGSDLNGKAAQHAAQQIRARLLDFAATRHGCEAGVLRLAGGSLWRCEPGAAPVRLEGFAELVQAAYRARVQLWASGFYATPKLHYDPRSMHGRPFFYFAYGASVSEVAIDVDTGESRVLRVDIEHDVGASLNPAVDRGQIEGGFVQGMGWLTTEELWWNAAGKLMTHAPSTYKIPCAGDVPEHFDVQLFPNQNAEDTIYRSKAVGEPPLMLANSVFLALRDAVSSVDGYRAPVPLDAPATAESILRAVRALQGRPFTEPRACA